MTKILTYQKHEDLAAHFNFIPFSTRPFDTWPLLFMHRMFWFRFHFFNKRSKIVRSLEFSCSSYMFLYRNSYIDGNYRQQSALLIRKSIKEKIAYSQVKTIFKMV